MRGGIARFGDLLGSLYLRWYPKGWVLQEISLWCLAVGVAWPDLSRFIVGGNEHNMLLFKFLLRCIKRSYLPSVLFEQLRVVNTRF